MKQLTQAYWLAKINTDFPELRKQLPEEYLKVEAFEGHLNRQDLRCLKRLEKTIVVASAKPDTFAFFAPLQLLLHRTIEQAEIDFCEANVSGVRDEDLVSPWWMGYIRGTLKIKGWPPN